MAVEAFINWREATNEQRQALYRTVKALMDAGKINWNTIARVLPRDPGTQAYFDNFRMGRNSRRDCELIYRYLKQSFPESAAHFARMIETPAKWLSFVRQNRTLGSLDLRLLRGRVGTFVPDMPDPQGWSDVRAFPNDKLYLHLRIQGLHTEALALSAPYGVNDWRPVPLASASGDVLIASVIQGEQTLRTNMFERNEWLGLVQLVLIAGKKTFLESLSQDWRLGAKLETAQLGDLTDALAGTPAPFWTMHQINFAVAP